MNDQFGILGVELKWFESYLTGKEQVCLVNGHLGHTSSPRKITCVPQGSILGPLYVRIVYKLHARLFKDHNTMSLYR